MKIRKEFFVILIIACFQLFCIAQTNFEVRHLTGNFSVSDAGSGNYSVPILLPSGAGGMKPSLTLSYSSNGTNGLMGVGWNISDISVIARGSKTIDQDGVVQGINFNSDDVFCLNGERLVLYDDTYNYGADGAEYGTETNSFVKVVSKGVSGSGPAYFEAYTKTGLKLTFGSNDASRVYVPGTQTVLYYLLNRMEENHVGIEGNYISYEYEIDPQNATYLPIRIVYTRNDNLPPGSNDGLTEVKFSYRDRNDKTSAYINGIQTGITKILTSIGIYQNDDIKEVYSFSYQEYGNNGTNLLEYIRHCIAATGECSEILEFKWETGATNLNFEKIDSPIPIAAIKGDKKEIHSQDLNNDGLTDVIIADRAGLNKTVSVEIYLNRGEGNFTKISTNLGSAPEYSNFNFIDANSDGYVDIVITNENGSILWYINPKNLDFSGMNLFKSVPNPVNVGAFKNVNLRKQYFFIDYNGDARQDLIIFDPDALPTTNFITLYKNVSDKNNLFHLISATDDLNISDDIVKNYYFVPVDFNNDGKTDFLAYSRNDRNGDNKIYINVAGSGEGFEESLWKFDKKWFTVYPDTYEDSGSNQSSKRSLNGQVYRIENSSIEEDVLTPKFNGIRNPSFSDLNGDGLLDMIISKTHNHFFEGRIFSPDPPHPEARSIQIEKVYTFINKGDFTFKEPIVITSPVNSISNNIGNPKYPLYTSPSNTCFLGFFNTYLAWNTGGGFWTRYTASNRHIHWQHPRYFVDLNGDGKSELVVRYDNTSVQILSDVSSQELICKGIKEYFSYNKDFQLSFGRFNKFGTDLFLYNTKTGENSIQKNVADGKPPVITKFSGQLGGDFKVEYASLNDDGVYVKGNSRAYPEIDFSSSGIIVKGYKQLFWNAKEWKNENLIDNTYKYYDGVLNLTGRGFRGFKKVEITDNVQGFKVVKQYEEDSRFIGANLKSSKNYAPNGQLLSEEHYRNVQWETSSDGSGTIYRPYGSKTVQDKIFTPFPSETMSRTYDLDGSLLVENKNRTFVDAFGNVIYQVFEHGDGCVDSIYNVYQNDFEHWMIGRLTNARVYKKCPGSQTVVRESSFEYHPVSGLLVKEVLEPNQSERIRVVKTYEHDLFGNITKSVESTWNGSQVVNRSKITKFDPSGRYQIESSNELGHKVSIKVDDYRGLPLESTDENGLVTKMVYNSFGILKEIHHPDGTKEFINTTFTVDGGFGSRIGMRSVTSGSNMPESSIYMDLNGREIESRGTLLDGRLSYTNKYYTPQNRLDYQSGPYKTNQYGYDIAGRITQIDEIGVDAVPLLRTSFAYQGLSETVTNPLQQQMTKIKDVRTRLLKSIDNDGNQLTYKYDTEGQLVKLIAGDNKYTILYEYDLRGRMTSMTDPVLGKEEYNYDGFGNLLSKKDGQGNVISYTYDNLNRLKTISQAEGVITYTYDQGNKAIGKLSKVTYPNYESSVLYDNLGRVAQNSILIEGKTYTYKYSYNSIGKIDRLEHPSGLMLKYHYNNQFYLYKVTNNQNAKLLWEIKKVDDKNRVIEEVLGNGTTNTYEYDSQDNLLHVKSFKGNTTITDLKFVFNEINLKVSKEDLKNSIKEEYFYDNLNRLTTVLTSGKLSKELNMTYDEWGNIKTKSDLGTYYYNDKVPTVLERIDFYDINCKLPSAQFEYEYTSFNKIKKITGDSVRLEITYGPSNQRLTQRLYINNSLKEARIYVSGDYEVLTINSIETKRVSVAGTSGTSVLYELTGTQGGKYNYLHRDDLGSVVAITNDLGALQFSYQYDVWGKRVYIDKTDSILGNTYRGFTGHEHIVVFELINMNGRIYDPIMGRFLSPDPYISGN
jgi:RHS repeat-associated protein